MQLKIFVERTKRNAISKALYRLRPLQKFDGCRQSSTFSNDSFRAFNVYSCSNPTAVPLNSNYGGQRGIQMNASQIRIGNVLEYGDGKLMLIKKTQHVRSGKGGAFIQVEMKDILNGTKQNERFRVDESVERVRLDDVSEYQYLYTEGENISLMNNEDFTQIEMPLDMLNEESQKCLEDGMNLSVVKFNDKPIMVNLPKQIEVTVEKVGAVVNTGFRPVTLNNGLNIKIPPFIEEGEKIIIDTENFEYVSRVN